jgi:general secretion pathway protein C
MSGTIQQSLFSNRATYAARAAQFEQMLSRFLGFLKLVPLHAWQWLLMLLLVIWLSHSLARLFWLLLPSPQIPPATVAVIAPATVLAGAGAGSGNSSSININQLKSLTPFGSAAAVEEVPAQEVATTGIENDASDTQLSLILRGVLGSNNESAARAIISSGDRNEVYAIGDKLPVGNNVSLAKVLDVRVILNNNGNYESLWLFKEDPNAPKIASTYNEAPAAPADNPYTREGGYSQPPFQQQPQIYGRNSGYESAEPGAAEMSKTLADVVAMSIHRENGQVVGYKIRPGRNAEMFNSLGLQTDDIVTAVNGVPLTSPGKIMEIYKNMSNATSANLEIKRGGSVINLDVVLN